MYLGYLRRVCFVMVELGQLEKKIGGSLTPVRTDNKVATERTPVNHFQSVEYTLRREVMPCHQPGVDRRLAPLGGCG